MKNGGRSSSFRGIALLIALALVLAATWFVHEYDTGRRGIPPDCGRTLAHIGQGLWLWAHERGGKYPPTLAEMVKTYSPNLPMCPQADPGASPDAVYTYFGAGKSPDDFSADDVLACDSEPRHDGGLVLFGDGHVTYYDAAEFAQITKPTTRPTSRSTR